MSNNTLPEIYEWAKANLNQRVLLGYQLYKVNGQVSNRVLILLREVGSRTANAEIEIDYFSERAFPYLAVFSLLPFNRGNPRPIQLRPTFLTQQAVISWLKNGQ